MNALIANFGNDSIGLIQYAYTQKLKNVAVVSVNTGWHNPAWSLRVREAEEWVKSLGFEWVRLKSRLDFAALVHAQEEFPSTKFQWCAIYLKGDTCRAWLAETDPLKEATILLARRRPQSAKFQDLPEFVAGQAEEFEDRKIWHPLYLNTEADLRHLVSETPFEWILHRSLECDPCVNSDAADLQRLRPDLIARVSQLEDDLHAPFLPGCYAGKKNLAAAWAHLTPGPSPFLFDMGCGSPYGCG